MSGRRWTATEDELIRRAYPTAPAGRVASVLGRSLLSVYKRASNLGVKREVRWTEAQDETVIGLHKSMGLAELAGLLGRTEIAVRSRICHLKKLGLIKGE